MIQEEMDALMQDVEVLVAATRRERAALRRASITSLVIGGALLVIVAVFLLVNYNRFKAEWTEEKLARGFSKELEVLHPAINDQVQRLGKYLMPVYASTGRQQLMTMRPEIADRLYREVTNLGADLKSNTESRLVTATDRVNERMSKVIFAAYPGLQDESEQTRLTENLHQSTSAAVRDALTEFGALFSEDILALESRIHGFYTEPTSEPTLEIEKRFIHLWLQLLDAEIMSK